MQFAQKEARAFINGNKDKEVRFIIGILVYNRLHVQGIVQRFEKLGAFDYTKEFFIESSRNAVDPEDLEDPQFFEMIFRSVLEEEHRGIFRSCWNTLEILEPAAV